MGEIRKKYMGKRGKEWSERWVKEERYGVRDGWT